MHFLSSSTCFDDTQRSLESEYGTKFDGSICLLGGWELANKISLDTLHRKYTKIIVFNQEQIGNKTHNFVTKEYYTLLKLADEVWDYDEWNINALKTLRSDIKLQILKPSSKLNAGCADTKDIDVLFYGCMNNRRQQILNELKNLGIKVAIPQMVFGDALNPWIARSRICLNIHYYADTALQEQARMIRWVSSHSNIISEVSRYNYLNVPEVPYKYIVHAILHQLGAF